MKTAQIVLIEDNPADVLLVELALKEAGIACELTKFKNGEEALLLLCPPIGTGSDIFVPDAILLDLNTPRSDGFEVLITFKRTPRLAGVPMAVLSSSQAPSDKHRIALQGARYLQKPAQLTDFLTRIGQAVREMLAEKTTDSESSVDPAL
jgi:chemotaxis family two-component system response regulator Rcp1